MDTKQCEKCGQDKPLDQFHVHRKAADGRMNKCKDCWNKRPRTSKRGYAAVTFTPRQSNDPRFKKILMGHGYSSACFYERLLRDGYDPDTARQLAEAAFSNNDMYGRLRRRFGFSFGMVRNG